jgi:hypothetical protein
VEGLLQVNFDQRGVGGCWSGYLDGLMLIKEGSRNWIWKKRFTHILVTKTYDHTLFGFAKVRRLSGIQRLEVDVEMMPFNKKFNCHTTWFSLWEHVPI